MTRLFHSRKRTNQGGFTLIEVLIATAITAIISLASFQFYVSMHNSTTTQQQISDMQQLCRASLDEMAKTLRMAGYKLDGHPAYEINGDSLAVYYSQTNPVDTVMYFLQEFTDQEYADLDSRRGDIKFYNLMKQVNSNLPTVFADCISGIRYSVVNSSTLAITLQTLTRKPDETHDANNGFRTFSATERVNIRNLSL
jgi:prepilin-type N-terminal cleavage/methylation domain-containing protein